MIIGVISLLGEYTKARENVSFLLKLHLIIDCKAAYLFYLYLAVGLKTTLR